MAKRAPPRSKLRIYFELMDAIDREGGRARFTRVQTAVGVPYDRFIAYLAELEERGLIVEEMGEDGNYLVLTESGRQFLRELRRLDYFLRGFGLTF